MNRRVLALGGLLAAAGFAVVVGLLVAVGTTPKPETAAPGLAGTLGLVLGVVVFLVAVVRSRGESDEEPAPWTDRGRIVDRTPEETPDDVAVSGTETAERLASATRAARSTGDVEAGVERVRPHLRRALGSALVAGGREPEAVERTLSNGDWTEDRLAAAVVDENVEPPERTFRERLRDWFAPERAVRERTRRTVTAIDEAAGEALPAVVGEDAPRTVPVVAPTLEDLQRTADGRLQRAETLGAGRWNEPGGDATDGSRPESPDPNGGTVREVGASEERREERKDREQGESGGVTANGDRSRANRSNADWDDVPGDGR